MATKIVIPDFDFSGHYYGEIVERLRIYARANVPELTDESEFEPFTQIQRMIALVGHQNNVTADLVANESTLPTAKLTETVRNMLRLIDYEMKSATPSEVDVVYELAKVFTSAADVVTESAQAATPKEGDNPVIFFEALEGLTIDRTDQLSYVLSDRAGTFTDVTTKANSGVSPGDNWNGWATAPAVKDSIYFGHKHVMFDVLDVAVVTPGANITGVWEYYDGEFSKAAPTSITNLGGSLEVDLTSYLGITNRAGTLIRVRLNETGAYEDVYSTWNGVKNIATVGLLGQTAVTTDAGKYAIGSDWQILTAITDETTGLTTSGEVAFTLPQTLTQDWKTTSVNGKTAYWLRYRVVQVATPTAPVLCKIRIDTGKQYVLRSCTQGRTIAESPLGSSTGLASQRFDTGKENFIQGSDEVTVGGEVWQRVDNFLDSQSTDKHYTVELGKNDRATVVFGDGKSGRVPPVGVGNIAITYRYGAQDNGNVGAQTVTVDKTGLTYINKLFNPRPAAGWAEAEGASTESLERVKVEGPASLRVRQVAVSPDDVVKLTKEFTDAGGASPYARARAFEEGFGPKTVELVVVVKGGGNASSDQLEELTEYFNGNPYSTPPKDKHMVANQQVTAVNFTPKLINIVATIYGDVTAEQVENHLNQVFQPEALKDDGITYEWEFGATVPVSRINHELFQADPSITNVVLATPAADVTLLPRELPKIGTITLTIVEP